MLKVKKINKSYQTQSVLKDCTIEFKQGEFVIIIGASGSGKTTLLNIIASLDKADSGEVLFKEKNLLLFSDLEIAEYRNKTIGICFQFFQLFAELTVKENILVPTWIAEVNLDNKYFDELVNIAQISNLLEKFPDELSGGEKQRVALIRSLIMKPEVLLLDEPTGSLDSQSGINIMELLKKLHLKYKPLVIMVTHNLDYQKYATKVIKIKDGAIVHEKS